MNGLRCRDSFFNTKSDVPGYKGINMNIYFPSTWKETRSANTEPSTVKEYGRQMGDTLKVGMTVDDIDMFELFRDNYKDIVVVANKIDKLNKNDQFLQLKKIRDIVFPSPVIPFSAVKRIGIEELIETIIPKSI